MPSHNSCIRWQLTGPWACMCPAQGHSRRCDVRPIAHGKAQQGLRQVPHSRHQQRDHPKSQHKLGPNTHQEAEDSHVLQAECWEHKAARQQGTASMHEPSLAARCRQDPPRRFQPGVLSNQPFVISRHTCPPTSQPGHWDCAGQLAVWQHGVLLPPAAAASSRGARQEAG